MKAISTRAILTLENLETRLNPSSYVNASGDLVVNGSYLSDNIQIRTSVNSAGVPFFAVVENGAYTWYRQSRVWGGDVYVYAGSGNDYVNNYASTLRLNAHGGDGNDELIGDGQNDYLNGGNGNDKLFGYNGHDTLFGGNGNDKLYGGNGNDFLQGHYGNDILYGGDGDDVVDGGDDGVTDYLYGGRGRDRFQDDVVRRAFYLARWNEHVDKFMDMTSEDVYYG